MWYKFCMWFYRRFIWLRVIDVPSQIRNLAKPYGVDLAKMRFQCIKLSVEQVDQMLNNVVGVDNVTRVALKNQMVQLGLMESAEITWEGKIPSKLYNDGKLFPLGLNELKRKLGKTMDLLRQAGEYLEEHPPTRTWWKEYLELTGEHWVLTEEGWEPGYVVSSYKEEDPEWKPLDEINAPRRREFEKVFSR